MNKPATIEDIPAIVELGKKFHDLSPWRDRPFDADQTAEFLAGMIENPNACLFWNGEGMIGGVIAPIYFGGGLVAQELFWFAEKGGMSLLDTFEEWAHNAGASGLIMVSLSLNERADSLMDRIYQRRGYRLRERTYYKDLV